MSKKAKKTLPKHLPMPEEQSKWSHERFRRQIRENHGAQCIVVGQEGPVVNPHEMKINAILAKESGRVPICYTVPSRSGKKIIRHFSETESEYSKVSYK